jgi:hypothetical protein
MILTRRANGAPYTHSLPLDSVYKVGRHNRLISFERYVEHSAVLSNFVEEFLK